MPSLPYPEPEKPRAFTGWVSPDGKFWACGFNEHADLAYYICAKLYPEDLAKKKENGSQVLEDLGYIRITRLNFGEGKIYAFSQKYIEHRFPDAARQTIYAIADAFEAEGDLDCSVRLRSQIDEF